jgi:FKBP-type peptidyl-prolyl cis-trans isomerase SlpA
MSQEIQIGSRVTFHFALTNPAGEELISTFGDEPSTITTGQQEIIEGLELALYGLRPGDRQTLLIAPDLMYGERDESLLKQIPLSGFGEPPQPGQLIQFNDAAGNGHSGLVVEINDQLVHVDFNHPLAGQDVTATIEVLDVD